MQILIEKLVFGGQALGRTPDGQVIFVWNALPGESVQVDVVKKKKTHAEAIATSILTPSEDRVEPREAHYLSSSPWGMMTWECENTWKKIVSVETFNKIGGIEMPEPKIVADEPQYGYRNKIEYSFYVEDPHNPDDTVHLAFFKRGGKGKIPITKSELATSAISKTAEDLLAWVREQHIPIRSLKSLIVRSNKKGETIAALFLKDKLTFDSYPALQGDFVGLQVYYSTHKSPASVPTELLYATGQDYLVEEILGTTLKYGLLSFFQVNIQLFEKTVEQIRDYIGPATSVIDFYAGAGAIGLPLASQQRSVVLVESNDEAVAYAKDSIVENGLEAVATAQLSPAEHIVDTIVPEIPLIVDPPRAGMHADVVNRIASHGPKQLIYLSCNLSTQARDLSLLKEQYKVVDWTLYNYFPRTPHIESLVLLERLPQVDQ